MEFHEQKQLQIAFRAADAALREYQQLYGRYESAELGADERKRAEDAITAAEDLLQHLEKAAFDVTCALNQKAQELYSMRAEIVATKARFGIGAPPK